MRSHGRCKSRIKIIHLALNLCTDTICVHECRIEWSKNWPIRSVHVLLLFPNYLLSPAYFLASEPIETPMVIPIIVLSKRLIYGRTYHSWGQVYK